MRNAHVGLLAGLLGLVSSVALASSEPAAAPPEREFKPTVGPAKVDAGHEIVVDLPDGYLFLDAPQAKKFMEKIGNLFNDDLLGVITQDEASWLVTIRYTGEGYVKDDEAEKLDAEEIFKASREGPGLGRLGNHSLGEVAVPFLLLVGSLSRLAQGSFDGGEAHLHALHRAAQAVPLLGEGPGRAGRLVLGRFQLGFKAGDFAGVVSSKRWRICSCSSASAASGSMVKSSLRASSP